ncbi:MAG TPA: exodeoxyribonuclease VII large subunit [Puia sp.]|jgi:exodeoxyribonuclease VII large subunit|nr:exodeoxyribonuclease VII large subunit [Puia sp.]
MPETVNNKSVFTLLEVTKSIKKTISERYKDAYWIRAELNKLNFYKQSGHCFPELVEKQDGRVVAQMRSTIWSDDYIRINKRFISVLNEPLKDGIKILFLASVNFEPTFGLSLHITDIDPAYTLGDLEKEKQETINKLQKENLFGKNKTLKLPLLPQRIAIISDLTSKGYADFIKIIENNGRGYHFFHMLFPSLLQGEKAIAALIGQLNRIRKVRNHFDAVAIIRGGGDDIGLSCYNNYLLAKEIAGFPIPVFTGIGHATNETVSEMISFHSAITPTKLAEWLIQRFHDFDDPVEHARGVMIDKSLRLIGEEKKRFQSEVKLFRSVTKNLLHQNKNELKLQVQSLFQQSIFRFRNEKQQSIQFHRSLSMGTLHFLKNKNSDLENMRKNIHNMSPENVLKRGYSITLLNGKSVKNAEASKKGDILHTTVFQGSIRSIVESSEKPDIHE